MGPWTVAHQAPLFMEFSRQEYWSGLPFPPPGDLPDTGIKSLSPALAERFITADPPGKTFIYVCIYIYIYTFRYVGEGNGNPLQYSCLENSMDGGVRWATVQGVAKSQTQLSDFTSLFRYVCVLEKEMATHSSISCLENTWIEKSVRLQSMELQRVRCNLVTQQEQQMCVCVCVCVCV